MSDAFLTDIPTDGELFELEVEKKDEQATEKPAGSSAEESVTEKAPSQEGAQDGGSSEENSSSNTPDDSNVPFNKHPRWQEMQSKLDRFQEENAKLLEAVGALTPKLEALETQRVELRNATKVPKLFVDLYGENAEAEYKEYKKEIDADIQKAQDEIYQKLEAEKRQKAEESERWNAWMQNSMSKVEEQFGVSMPDGSSERNEFLKYVLKYKPTDDNGNIDFTLGYELFSQAKEASLLKKSEKNSVRKSIAAKTTHERGAEPKTNYVASHKTLRNKSFLDVALESLKEL